MNRIRRIDLRRETVITLATVFLSAFPLMMLHAQNSGPLETLSVSPGTLSPAFNANTGNYTVSGITSDDNRITFHATVDSGYVKDLWLVYLGMSPSFEGETTGAFSARDLGPVTAGHQVALSYGKNRYRYYVGRNLVDRVSTSEDSVYSYTFTITRPKPPLAISGITQTSVDENSTESSVASYSVSSAYSVDYTDKNILSLFAQSSDDPVTWSVAGADSNDFVLRKPISSSQPTVFLVFAETPDYEKATDADSNNVYTIEVRATAEGQSDSLAVSVTVEDVNESPTLAEDDLTWLEFRRSADGSTLLDPDDQIEFTEGDTTYFIVRGGYAPADIQQYSVKVAISTSDSSKFKLVGPSTVLVDNAVYFRASGQGWQTNTTVYLAAMEDDDTDDDTVTLTFSDTYGAYGNASTEFTVNITDNDN